MYSVNGYRRYSKDVDNTFNIIPSGRISMRGVDFPVIGVDEFGIIQFMQPEKEYQFPGNTVFEVPIKQDGGMTGMMKARLALDSHFGNETARRMANYDTRNYKFDDGNVGNVYVSSYDNLVTPHIQLDKNDNLIYVDDVWSDNNKERSYQQSMKFERPEDAEYFGKNYKRVAPMKNLYQDGGYVQEEDPTTQLLYSIAESLQQGNDPREILNALKQNGVPEEQAMELIKYVMEQMQQQDQLQKEEGQQLEYAQDGKIIRKHNVEDLDWDKGINRAMLAFNMLQTPGLWQAPVKHGMLDGLKAGLGLAAGLSGVGLGYSKLFSKDKIHAQDPKEKPIVSNPYIPEGKDVTKIVKPSSDIPTWDWQTQHPDLTAANMTGKASYTVPNKDNTVNNWYNAPGQNTIGPVEFAKGGMKKYQWGGPKGDQVMNMTSMNQMNPEAFNITFNSMYPYFPYLKNTQSSTTAQQEQNKNKDNVKKEEIEQTFYTGDPYGMLMANNAILGFQKFNDYLSDKDYEREYNKRMIQIGNTNAKYNPINYDNPYGTYTPNVGIGSNYGLVANGPIQDFGTGMFMAEKGGKLPQMQTAGITSNKSVDPNREKNIDVSNKKNNKFFSGVKETLQNMDLPLLNKTYYFNGKPYVYSPEKQKGKRTYFISSDPNNNIKEIDVDIVDFNKALNKDQVVNNYYEKYYSYDNKPDLSKFKLERYYVSDNEENAKSYEEPDFYMFKGKDSEYKIPLYKFVGDMVPPELVKDNMDRVIQKGDKLYFLHYAYLHDTPYFEYEPRYKEKLINTPDMGIFYNNDERISDYKYKERVSDYYKVGFKSEPIIEVAPLKNNYEHVFFDAFEKWKEDDLKDARRAFNPFAEKEEESTNTSKTTTTTQSSSKNNVSGKSTVQNKNNRTYNRKEAKMLF